MTPIRIDETVLARVREALSERTESGWGEPALEVQDDWRFLLVTIDVSATPVQESYAPFCGAFEHILSPIIPARDDDYPWMVIFVRDGKVVDSCIPGVP